MTSTRQIGNTSKNNDSDKPLDPDAAPFPLTKEKCTREGTEAQSMLNAVDQDEYLRLQSSDKENNTINQEWMRVQNRHNHKEIS